MISRFDNLFVFDTKKGPTFGTFGAKKTEDTPYVRPTSTLFDTLKKENADKTISTVLVKFLKKELKTMIKLLMKLQKKF